MKEEYLNKTDVGIREKNYVDYKEMTFGLLEQVESNDVIFLRQIYTIIKKHIKKKESH